MPPETDNLKLEELYDEDQKDRTTVYTSDTAVQELAERDARRRRLVYEMMGRGEVNTKNDLYRAALILQHGSMPSDFMAAHRLATMAAVNGHRPSRWLAAASLDRFLMAMAQPQLYGTQFEHNRADNRYELRLPMDDSRLLSFERRFFDVPPVAERLEQLNKRIQEAPK